MTHLHLLTTLFEAALIYPLPVQVTRNDDTTVAEQLSYSWKSSFFGLLQSHHIFAEGECDLPADECSFMLSKCLR